MTGKLTYQKQTKLNDPEKGIRGNCMMTCYCNLLGIDVEEAPRIEELFSCKQPEGFWWDALQLFLRKHGYDVVLGDDHESVIEAVNGGFYMAYGYTTRSNEVLHQVIYQNGKLVFDPHPDNTGITEIKGLEYLIPIQK